MTAPVPIPSRAGSTLATLVRFVVVGGVNTALTYVVFRALLAALAPHAGAAAVAQAVGYAVGATFSFFANRQWTFGGTARRGAFFRFLVAQGAALCLSALGVEALIAAGASPNVAWVLVTGAVTVLNFLVMRAWVFAK